MRSLYVLGEPVTGTDFYGRDRELEILLHDRGRTVHVLGMRRIGKTSLLRKVAELVPSVFLDFQAMVGQPDLFAQQVRYQLRRLRRQCSWLSAVNASVYHSDARSRYEAGLRKLLDRLDRNHPRYTEALTYEQRLRENIVQSQQYGDTETRKVDRSEIIARLNELALSAFGISFNEFCNRAIDATKQESVERLPPNQGNDGFVWLEEAAWGAEEQGVTLFLLCDEAEGLLDFDALFLRRLRGLIWGSCRLRTILASAKNLSKLDDLCRKWDTSPFLNNFPPPLYLSGLDDAAATDLIRQAQSESPLSVPDKTVSALKRHTGNHPYLIQWLCYQLWEDKNRNLEAWTVTPVDLQPRGQLARRLQMDFDYLSDPERRILYAVIHKGLLPTDVDPDYVRGLKSLGYIRQEGDSYAIGNTFLERWLESADWKAKSDISAESTLTLYKREGVLSMATPDPVVTAWAIATLSKATDWLFNQAGEILKEWREKRKQEAAAKEPSPPELVPSNQPPVTNADVLLEALQGQAELSARRMEIQQVESLMRQLERHHKKILDYQEKLSSYLDVEVELRLRDRLDKEQSEIARKANKMRQILERLSGKSVIVPGLDE